jgi:hypothetical protein
MKKRKCKECKEWFTPSPHMFLPPTCEKMDCRISYANKHLAKKKLEVKKEARKALKKFNSSDINILKRLAQKLFNQYIRLRDGKICISCGFIGDGRQFHCGHYKSQGGNSLLRYNEDNCHSQCSICNNHLSGNLVPYRVNLIEKIGLARVKEMESMKTIKKWDEEELSEIITIYRQKIKELK